MSNLARLLLLQDKISDIVGKSVSWLCLVMIGVLMFEILARYILNRPTEWAHESTTMLYGTFCIIAGVYTHLHNGHVRSEVIYQLFSPRKRALLDVITGFIGLIIFGVFFVVVLEFAVESWQTGERSSKSTWAPPIAPFKSVLPLAAALIWLQSLVHLIRDIAYAFDVMPELQKQGAEHRELQIEHIQDDHLPITETETKAESDTTSGTETKPGTDNEKGDKP